MNSSEIIMTGCRGQIQDLDALPFWDRSLIDYRKYHKYVGQSGVRNVVTLQGSRGCPFRCFYCDVQYITPRHIRRSPANILSEVKELYRRGVRRFEFIDDSFNINKTEFAAFLQGVLDNHLECKFYFTTGLRGDALDKDIIDLMVAAGTSSMQLSLESASPRLQRLMCKNLNLDKLHENLDYIATQYPHVVLSLNAMLGFPTETEEEAQATIDYIKSIHWIHFPLLHNVRIFPNSRIQQIALENGVTQEEINQSLTLPYHVIAPTIKMDHEFLSKLRLEFLHSYIFNKKRLKHILTQELAICSEEELVFKYRTIFPTHIDSLDDILKLARIKRADLQVEPQKDEPNLIEYSYVEQKNAKSDRTLNVLYLDATQFFSEDEPYNALNIVEVPMGGMAIISYLRNNINSGGSIFGWVKKTGIDYDSYEELQQGIKDIKPQLLLIRTMTYYKDFGLSLFTVGRYLHGYGVVAITHASIRFAFLVPPS